MSRNEYMKNYMRNYRKTSPLYKIHSKNANESRRIRAMLKIKLVLVCKCGRNDLSILEIHHTNNNGSEDRKNRKGDKFYDDIIQGRRKTDDLDILCVVCNWEEQLKVLKKLHPLE
ncbi:hypothetical protein [Nitrosopumilus sp.]|uniref:hypothetical protein n=1 Tax=Nitrosopumilus sp. TaxID=2024843 RepID=UPI003D0F3100